jgi:hypothetical protein
MKKFLILLTILVLIAQPLMAASFNATHKSILEAKLEKLLEIDGNDVRSMTLAAIALKESLTSRPTDIKIASRTATGSVRMIMSGSLYQISFNTTPKGVLRVIK